MIKYYIRYNDEDVLFASCEEGSFMDIAIRAMQKEEYLKGQRKVYKSIIENGYVPMLKKEDYKDALKVVERK